MAGLTFILSGGAAILAKLRRPRDLSRGRRRWSSRSSPALWLVVAVYFLGDISAHFNPATTLAFALRRDMELGDGIGATGSSSSPPPPCGSLLARAFFGPAGNLAATHAAARPVLASRRLRDDHHLRSGSDGVNMANGPKLNGPFVPLAVGAYIMAWATDGRTVSRAPP